MDVQECDRYFIGIVPPIDITEEVNQFRHFIAAEFHAIAALRSPPHITLHMPFLWKKKKESTLVAALDEFCSGRHAFRIGLNGFDCFPPRVIFVNVAPTEALNELEIDLGRMCREKLNLVNARYKEFPFHPHVTIAFRDLRKATFNHAWEHFNGRSYAAHFDAEALILFRQEDKRWAEHKRFLLVKARVDSPSAY